MNVALNKNGKYCDIRKVSKLIFDGDTNYKNSERFRDTCSLFKHAFLRINLVELHSIQHVVVHHGTGKHVCFLRWLTISFIGNDLLEYNLHIFMHLTR